MHDPQIHSLQETHPRTKDLHSLRVKGWTQISQANGQGKKAKVAIFMSHKIDFKRRAINRDPEMEITWRVPAGGMGGDRGENVQRISSINSR